MIYLKAIRQKEHLRETDAYPLSLPAVAALERLEFTTPVTLLAGDNGAGKTTLMELIASAAGAVRVGGAGGGSDAHAAFQTAARVFRTEFVHKPLHSFFFLAEDFTRYIDRRVAMIREEQEELDRVAHEYAGRSAYARGQASMPHASELAQLRGMYGEELSERSHGEGYIDFFGARLRDGGLYLMDEPEGALSYYNQYVLMHMIADAAARSCQFIISTHSPILLAYPDARLLLAREDGYREGTYADLKNIAFLRDFLASPQRYLRELAKTD